MANDLPEADFAAMIGVPLEQLAALERDGLPTVGKRKPFRYPVPTAVRWFIDYSVTHRVGGIPPRVNREDLSSLLGISTRQVKNLVDQGKLSSVVERGRRLYPVPGVVHEFVRYQQELARGAKKEELDPLNAARLRKLNAEADQAEMAAVRARGEFIDRVTQQRSVAEILQAFRSQLNQVPSRYDRKFVQLPTAARARHVLKEIINGELVRLGAAVAAVGKRIQIIAEDLTSDEQEHTDPDGVEPASAAAPAEGA